MNTRVERLERDMHGGLQRCQHLGCGRTPACAPARAMIMIRIQDEIN
jgi:hypothetical protein